MLPHIRSVANGFAATIGLSLLLNDPALAQAARPSARPTSGNQGIAAVNRGATKGGGVTSDGSKPTVDLQLDLVPPIDVDPDAPIQPRTPFPKWGAAGPGSILAQMGNHARLTGRVYVKFRDDLRVRTTMSAGTTLSIENTAGFSPIGGVDDDQDPIAEARAVLAGFGGQIEQAIKIPLPRLKAIEERATILSRKEQPDLGSFMLVNVGVAQARAAAEAFNELDCVEFSHVELQGKPAQCQPLDQSLQKGPGGVGANVAGCNQGTNANGQPFICQPYPIIALPQAQGSVTAGYISCNKPSFWANYIPINNQPLPNAQQACQPAGGFQPDLRSRPIWDCTPSCNNPVNCADTTSTLWTQGGNPTCQYGCADFNCANAVALYQPNCIDMTNPQGWDAVCATLASVICPPQVGSPTPYNGQGNTVGGLAVDQITQRCYQTLAPTTPVPPAPLTAATPFDIYNNFTYDPCFVARGPANYTVSAGRGVVVYTDIGDGSGIRPWGFTYASPGVPSSMPPFAYLQFAAAGSGTFDNTAQGAPGNVTQPCTRGIGATPIGGTVLNVNPFDSTLAGANARFDPVYKGGPQLFSHDCTTVSSVPGCYNSPCCAFVCITDPSCCDVGWDQSCVDLARSAAAPAICAAAALGIPAAAPVSPSFNAVTNPLTAVATNLQLFTTKKPVANSTAQYIANCPVGTVSGPVPLSAVGNQAALNGTQAFINCQYGGGGLDIEGFENFALQLSNAETGTPVTAAQARGQTVRVGVIDYSAYVNHEDLVGQVTVEAGQRPFIQPGGQIDPDHGTAVLGVLVAADNGIGITGVAPAASAVFYPAATSAQAGRIATAIVSAGEDLAVGDVLCIPIELGAGATICSTATYNVLLGVTASLGITNICAAGNGGFLTLAPASGANNAVLVSSVWPGPQTPTPVSGAKPPPPAPNTLTNPGVIAPGNSYCRYKSSNYSGAVGTGAGVDVSGWGTGICTLGAGTLWNGTTPPGTPPLEINKLRSYQQFFGDSSGATAMVAGLACRIQAVAKASLGAAVSGERIRQVFANQLWVDGNLVIGSNGLPVPIDSAIPQCNLAPGIALPGTQNNAFFVVAYGDLIAPPLNSQTNLVGGFPKAVDCLQQVVFTQFYPRGVFFDITVINGLRIASSIFDAAALDGASFRVGAVRRGRGSTGAGFGRPLVYAASGLVTDLQLRGRLRVNSPSELFELAVLGYGKVSTGIQSGSGNNSGSINGQALAMAYAYDNRYQRWRYLAFGFVDGTPPVNGSPEIRGIATTPFGYAPENFVVNENGNNVVYVRVVTFSAGIVGAYQIWWDQLVIDTSPQANP
ncbi:MAG: hypothetical protein EBQ99_02325 [Planctomycetes bacterium]|nr:hypothetical protein [Planctomycetota bacterium]